MRRSSVRKLVLVSALALTFALVPTAMTTDSAVAFEYFEQCPAQMCNSYPLSTAGVCDGPNGALLVKRDYWGTLCTEPIG